MVSWQSYLTEHTAAPPDAPGRCCPATIFAKEPQHLGHHLLPASSDGELVLQGPMSWPQHQGCWAGQSHLFRQCALVAELRSRQCAKVAFNKRMHDSTEQHVHLWVQNCMIRGTTSFTVAFLNMQPYSSMPKLPDIHAGAAVRPEALFSAATSTRSKQAPTHAAGALCPEGRLSAPGRHACA